MTPTTLPINEILVEDRQRRDLGDIDRLAESLSRYGLIQPIVVTTSKRLVAGGRRLAAATKLGWTHVGIVYRECLTPDEAYELELEENVRRKDMSWQERCLNIAKIHTLKANRNALEGSEWGHKETGEMFGLQKSQVGYTLTLARLLADPQHAAWQCTTMSEAWRDCVMKSNIEEAEAELAKRQAELTQDASILGYIGDTNNHEVHLSTLLPGPIGDVPNFAGQATDKADAEKRYYSNPANPPGTFEAYWQERQQTLAQAPKVNLTGRFRHGDGITFMLDPANAGRFDHIITDPPYAIDMEMLNQQNPHGGMTDIEDILDAHEVEPNKELLARFFPAAYACTKPDAFVVTWCDQMLWQYVYDLATAAGFKVQRWPITWCKLHCCINQIAQYNFTKDTEIAMVCRKGKATLVEPALTCRIAASNDDIKRIIGHPFAKPAECWQFFAKHLCLKGQLILDPFIGRGSSAIALLPMEMRMVGVELEELHYNALMENLRRYYLTLNPSFIFL